MSPIAESKLTQDWLELALQWRDLDVPDELGLGLEEVDGFGRLEDGAEVGEAAADLECCCSCLGSSSGISGAKQSSSS